MSEKATYHKANSACGITGSATILRRVALNFPLCTFYNKQKDGPETTWLLCVHSTNMVSQHALFKEKVLKKGGGRFEKNGSQHA